MIGQGGVILTCAVTNNTAFDAQWRQPNDIIKHQNGSEWGIFLISFAWNIRRSMVNGRRTKHSTSKYVKRQQTCPIIIYNVLKIKNIYILRG